jgi:lysophospholipase L1-like esterase
MIETAHRGARLQGWALAAGLSCLATAACGNDAPNPMTMTAPAPARSGESPVGDAGPPGSSPAPAADAAATTPPAPDGAAPAPTAAPKRLIVLGDSIVACLGVGDKDGPDCSPKKLHGYLAAGPAPGIIYENDAISGAVTADVPDHELPGVHGGPGPTLVLIFVGGNDLRPYLIGTDTAAEAGFAMVVPKIQASWQKIFAFFADRSQFPDGATVLMNNQYDPFDDCTAAPYFISAKKHELLRSYNDVLARLAHDNGAILTEQYTSYLGHGHHYAVMACPHYQAGAVPFMNDLIHPNAAGHDHLFLQWKPIVDGLYPRP